MPPRSCTLPTVTRTKSSKPSVSTNTCLLRPLIFFHASTPRSPACSVQRTVWLSTLPALGSGFRPTAFLTLRTSVRLIAAPVPSRSKWPQPAYTVFQQGKLCGRSRLGQVWEAAQPVRCCLWAKTRAGPIGAVVLKTIPICPRHIRLFRSTYKMTHKISNKSTLRGCPTGLVQVNRRARRLYCLRVRSWEYAFQVIRIPIKLIE